ncbi:MAG: hypothetical protein H8E14_16765 [Candidatus Marinimicrobia bacterium]|nr:hypothetical protein [Candidatus Neomarinimicrobiota bacterium]
MKRINISIVALALIGLVACGGKKQPEHKMASGSPETMAMADHEKMKMGGEMKGMSDQEQLIYYTCPMEKHKHIHSQEAGNCTECGMKMVEAVVTTEDQAEFYGCPMEAHSHVRSDKPGVCESCGMKLKPMRLNKS